MSKPRYPVYVISKGRHDCCITAKFFLRDGLDFRLVVEPQQVEDYAKYFPRELLAVLPFSNLGLGSMPARNWCWEDAKSHGHARHWIFDDNINCLGRLYKGKRIPCNANIALVVAEDFTERYTNIGLSGFNYRMFVPDNCQKPFYYNTHVYSALLIDNSLPFRWRMRYNEDTDLCLQILTSGLCTLAFNAFFAHKRETLNMKGGNMDALYQGDGRLKMARSLEAMWPDYVEVRHKFGRAQHHVDWKRHFTHGLTKRRDLVIAQNDYGMKLNAVAAIQSPEVRAFYEANK